MDATTETHDFDVVGAIIAFESGELDEDGTLLLFAKLIRTGQAWSLQGSYGRAAVALIEAGKITAEGVIVPEGETVEVPERELRRPDLVGSFCECGAPFDPELIHRSDPSAKGGYACAR